MNSIENALKVAGEQEKEEVFIIGGGQIYKLFLAYADKLYLTEIAATAKADTYFPDYSDFKVKVEAGSGEFGPIKYKFLELTRDA